VKRAFAGFALRGGDRNMHPVIRHGADLNGSDVGGAAWINGNARRWLGEASRPVGGFEIFIYDLEIAFGILRDDVA
jgi:hypothetical protein